MVFYVRMVALSLLLTTYFPSLAQQACDCVNTGNCPVAIVDNGSYDGTLNVTVSGDNDLGSCPLTSVCFTITHTWIGDLSVALTSPSGVNYLLMADVNNNYGGCGMQEDNVDICIFPGSFNPPATDGAGNLTEYICNTGPCPAGNCCMTGIYTMACGGVTDPINGALEAPNCDLNDFNIPGDPANGIWTLTVVDVCNMDTGTLDNFSLTFACGVETCISCEADGGTLDSISVTSCVGNPDLDLNLSPNYTGSPPIDTMYGYGYVISQNGVVLEIDTTGADLTSQPPGTYQVQGVSYYLSDSIDLDGMIGLDTATIISQLATTTAPFCGALSANWITVTILPAIPVTILDTVVCEGDCIMVGNQQVCSSTSVTLVSVLGCDSVVNVTLTPILPDTTDFTANVCSGGCIDVGGNQYCAPGPYYVTLTNVFGCDSVVNLSFNEITATAVIAPPNPSTLTCMAGSTVLDGSSSSGDTFEWVGPNGFSSDQSSITVTEPGTYTLTVYDNTVSPACQASTDVTVGDGLVPPNLIVVGAAPSICEGEIFDLSSLNIQDQNNTNPAVTFHSGTPATPANELSATNVSPNTTTTYYILGETGSCTDETSIVLTVVTMPTADFAATSAICATDEATVTYNGNASANATYNWDFDGGVAAPGTGAGPHLVSWPGGGNHTVSLTIEQNGCTSATFTQDVMVDMPLPIPNISCSPTTSSIGFSWDPVPGSTGFDVNVIYKPNGSSLAQNLDTAVVFNGLNPGEYITIEVIALGSNSCGNSVSQLTCYAQDCPTVTLGISNVPDICLVPNPSPVSLQATATGGTGNGTFVWSGTGVSSSGNFDPDLGTLGVNTLTLNYYEDNCIYTENIDIILHETPLVAIDVPSFICASDTITITYAGIAPAGSIYTWDFEGGTVITTGTLGEIVDVVWPVGGTYDISLTVESPSGCISETLVLPISLYTPLAEPNIMCDATSSSIDFSWTPDPNASSYAVTFPGGHNGIKISNTHYQVINLGEGESVDIIVQAIGAIPCGNSTFQTSCMTNTCEPVDMNITPVADICRDAMTAPFMLNATITGDTSNGTLTWIGNGVDANGLFDPAQANPGANVMTLTYEEGTCFFAESITINVSDTPVADFTADAITCAGNAITVNYTGTNNTNLNYTWDFAGGATSNGIGSGPHDVTWTTAGTYTITLVVENADGCFSEMASMDVLVEEPLQTPVIDCSATTTSVTFTWNSVPGVQDSSIVVSTPQAGVLQGNTYTINGLQPSTPVDFELTLLSASGICPAVVVPFSCASEDCPIITVDVEEVADICLGTSLAFPLNVVVTGSDGSGAGTWSGNGVDAASGMFDPASAGFGTHILKYTFQEVACTYEDSILVNIYQQPTSDFTADAVICITEATLVTFEGVAGATADFIWDFDGGTAIPGIGLGPHQVTWDTPGAKTISLNIDENGCTAGQFGQTVQVNEELAIPIISCTSTTASVEFTWTDVTGATGYDFEILNQGSGTQSTTDLTYLVSGLDPGEEVILQLVPTGNTVCPPQPTSFACSASLCSDVIVEIVPVAPICFVPEASQVVLQSTVSSSSGNGTGQWSGPGVIDPVAGIFDPLEAGVGLHQISYDYQLVNCTFSETIEIKVAPPPTADAGEDASLTCWNSGSSFRLGGDNSSSGPNVIYEWTTVTGSLPDNVHILRPEVTEPGTYILTVTDVELGCSDSDEVVISALTDLPIAEISFSPSDCSRQNSTIAIENVSGGVEPYLFSLNGEPYVNADTFAFLPPGIYTLSVIDAAGCESEMEFEVETLGGELTLDLTANLVGRNHIDEGDSIHLVALTNVPFDQLDSVEWSNTDLLSCTNCLNPIARPTEVTTFQLTAYLNGCSVSDEITIHVEYKSPVYVPNVFSPNGDDVNDILQLYPGPRVAKIKYFMIFDRWGEMVCIKENFSPDDPGAGWDGTLDGKELNPAVFAWFAEVELIDGSVRMLKGDVTLIR